MVQAVSLLDFVGKLGGDESVEAESKKVNQLEGEKVWTESGCNRHGTCTLCQGSAAVAIITLIDLL